MNTPGVIFTLGGLRLTQYGLCIALGLLAGYLMAQYQARAYGIGMRALRRVYLSALLGMAVCARLVYVIANFSFYGQYPSAIFKLWQGGYSVMGAVLGAVAGLSVGAGRRGFRRALDVIMPALLAMLAIWRLGELATWQGRGLMLGDGAPGFPLTVANSQGRRCLAVCVYEAVAALAIFGYALPRRQELPSGGVGLTSLALLALCQIPLESMRNDDFLALGFVKIDQLISAVVVVCLSAVFLRGHLRAERDRLAGFGALAITLGMVALCVVEEFRLDDSQYPMRNYAMLAIYSLAMAASALFLRRGWCAYRLKQTGRARQADTAPEWANAAPRDSRPTQAYYPAGRERRSTSYHDRAIAEVRRAAAEGRKYEPRGPYGERSARPTGQQQGEPRTSSQGGYASGSARYGARRESQYAPRYEGKRAEFNPPRYDAPRSQSSNARSSQREGGEPPRSYSGSSARDSGRR